MKVKHRQLYSNDCGEKAINNLLSLYGKRKVEINYLKEGTSIFQIKEELKKYFYDVKAVSFDINDLKKIKEFTPFIALIKNKETSHYIVIFKRTKHFLYIIDSAFKRSYKTTYESFGKVDCKCYIVASDYKEIKVNLKNNKYLLFIPFFALIEAILTLSTTIMLQMIIDNGLSDALIYFIVQLILLVITYIKIEFFLKFFKSLDGNLVSNTLKGIFNLKEEYINKHDKKELYYRVFDAYNFKSMTLSITFDIIGDVILLFLSIALMLIYSWKLTLIILFLCIIVVVSSLIYFIKLKDNVEEKRINEYEFIDSFKLNYNNDKIGDLSEVLAKLKSFQEKDFKSNELSLTNNFILLSFQSFSTCILIFLYFLKVDYDLSIGSLIALINLAYLIISPLLSICTQIVDLSNIKLLKNRLKDLNAHLK